MSVIHGTFTAGDRFRDPDEQFAEIRQSIVDSLKRTIDSAKDGWLFPGLLVEAIENEIWLHPRKTDYFLAEPMPLSQFIRAPYPRGLGTTAEIIEKLIAGNERAMLAWDRAFRGAHGGAREGAGRKPAAAEPSAAEIKFDNVKLEKGRSDAPTGNSVNHGLRRLERAAQAGDGSAADALRRVLDPKDPLSVNGACVALGWRKPTRTVVDTAEGLSDAVVKRLGPVDAMRQIWARASLQERQEIAAWIDAVRAGAPT